MGLGSLYPGNDSNAARVENFEQLRTGYTVYQFFKLPCVEMTKTERIEEKLYDSFKRWKGPYD